MPERDATLDAFISSSTEEDVEAEDEQADPKDADGATIDDQPDAEMGGDSGEDGVGDGVDGEAVPADDSEAVPADDGPESAVTTMAWSPAGEACEACGDTTLRRWRTDSGFLCPSCVDWERTPNQ